MSETFHYDAIFRDKDEADEYFLCIHNDIELCLADKIRNLSMEKLHWLYNFSMDEINEFLNMSYGYTRNDYLVFLYSKGDRASQINRNAEGKERYSDLTVGANGR